MHPRGLGEIECSYSTIVGPCPAMPHVRNGSFASVWPDHGDFRSTPVNGHSQDRRACLKGAKLGSRSIHSITSSARTSNDGGTVRPSPFALFMLIPISNLVCLSNRRSAGF